MTNIKQAISLINQGRKKEAQPLLTEIIRAHPQEIPAWFWYVETLDSPEKRIQVLETCLRQNPGNLQVSKALELLRARHSVDQPASPVTSNAEKLAYFAEEGETSLSTSHSYNYEPSPGLTFAAQESVSEEQGDDMPNILIPENEKVIAYFKSVNVYHAMIVPFSYDKVNDNHVHSDFSGILMDQAANLPQNCKYVVYGFPVLVSPKSGLIFGFAMGMSVSYRLPDNLVDEYRAYLEKKSAHVRKIKPQKKSGGEIVSNHSALPLERNWTDGVSFTGIMLRKLYDYYGRGKDHNMILPLNVEEDLKKAPPPPSFIDNLLDRIFLLSFPVVICLIMGLIIYLMNNFKIIDLINLFKNR